MSRFDPEQVALFLGNWVARQVSQAGARGAMVNISGGLDSAVVGALCARALPGRTAGLVLPCYSLPGDVDDAREVAACFGIPLELIDLGPVHDLLTGACHRAFTRFTGDASSPPEGVTANVKARLRMVTLYYFANRFNYLAVGTGNLSEITVGYFTKYGDGGVDIQPIGGLVKEEVRALARYLGVPPGIIDKPPSAGLWPGQTDEGELGLTYAELDTYIRTGEAPAGVKARIETLKDRSSHKRAVPPVASWRRD
jgi:NAD+ synthase